MQNDLEDKKFNINDKDLKQLYSKIMTISGYIIAMRSDCIKEAKKTEAALKILIRRTYDIRGGLWICLITIWFLVILFLQKTFS
ncbi:MAG: hypothetical protein LF885_06630 [Rickettsia endosymbiont of Culicoides impunctatus]|uniref:hypothetical protein n=1 Tax=unclassified Candidatus Tisiphia TaxID=2996318 RepID=UPI001E75F9D7|nr:hypothetical protein [Rickettsia endosymbiont of Platyusa sonomae]UCM85615.1 MAG: hypothetical protein LF885_06630 [Rickettsia endosymbiont of Culicoides impunctatus]